MTASLFFEGVPMSSLLAHVGATGDMAEVLALNNYRTTIPIADFSAYPVLLALKQDGQYMTVRNKGPLFIIYPFDEFPELRADLYYSRSAWQVRSITDQVTQGSNSPMLPLVWFRHLAFVIMAVLGIAAILHARVVQDSAAAVNESMRFDVSWIGAHGRIEAAQLEVHLARYAAMHRQEDADGAELFYQILMGRLDSWNVGGYRRISRLLPRKPGGI